MDSINSHVCDNFIELLGYIALEPKPCERCGQTIYFIITKKKKPDGKPVWMPVTKDAMRHSTVCNHNSPPPQRPAPQRQYQPPPQDDDVPF